MKFLGLFFVLISLAAGCRKTNSRISGAKSVEIYLLSDYEKVSGKCAIDPPTAVMENSAVIGNADILEYSKSEHTFLLTSDAFERARAFMDWQGFAVVVDKKPVYYGIYKPMISSSSCDESVTMDAFFPGEKRIAIRLGYPSFSASPTFNDPRNNPALMSALEAQGKLKR